MDSLSGLMGFESEDELPLLDQRLRRVTELLDPETHEARFTRVCEIVGIPEPEPDPAVHDVDLPRLLEITSGSEAREFRQWLRGVDEFTDEELAEAFHPMRDAIRKAVRTPVAKGLRFATTTGVGVFVPPAGIALSALDTFVVEKLLPGPGPTAFLSRLYPSVLDGG
jgi:hypothetical protein